MKTEKQYMSIATSDI